ncbi:antibiotic biosynthesis monooxygenase family protein [Nocardia sp. NPDC051030]|uniref:putative quinol monooxygenase n=1 Tax=Nocardia sp. NPDC051030 TaxID=3155162 RepID=UPI00343A69AC
MPRVSLLSRVKVKNGRGGEFVDTFQPVFEQAEKEPGTLVYLLNRSREDPDLFWVSEVYADETAFATHQGSAAMAAAAGAFRELIAEAEFLRGEPLASKGLSG